MEIINMFTKKTLGLTFILSAAAFAFAQEKVSITGTVGSKNSQPVPYASVTFSNKENKLFSDAALTDEKGRYKLDLTPGNYDITVEAIDYQKKVIQKQITQAGNIGSFSIEPEKSATNLKTQDIQGVTITVQAKPYKVELDKKTYDPSQDIVSKGGTLQDVLTNVPSVSVESDGSVSMRGSSNIRFLINGKPSALLGIDDGANALQSIPADQIERIEVITNPSSKFEASGTAGILNIILKKTKKTGFNGSVTGTLGYLPQTALNTNLSWRKGKFTWFLNGGGGYRESRMTLRNDSRFNTGPLQRIDNESITQTKNDNYNASAGLTYDINDKTSLNASGTVRTFDNQSNGNITYYDYLTNNTVDFRQRSNTGIGNNLAFQGDLGLDHKFDDKGQNLSLSASLQRNRTNNDTDIFDTKNGDFQLQDWVMQRTVNQSFIGKADYELPLGEHSKIEAGYRLDINRNSYNNMVTERTASDPLVSFLEDYSYNATYKEMFNAFYLQFKSKIGKLGYQVGLRDEISKVDIDYLNLAGAAQKTTKNYNNLFPSVFLSYEIVKDNQFLINYSRRIDRPRPFFMIPNPSYNDNQNIFDGNIDLNPSYVDSYELGYSVSKKSFTINPTLYYRRSTDDVKMLVYNTTDENGINTFHTRPINLGNDDRYGLDLNFNWDATKWLKFMGNIDLFGYQTTGIYTGAEVTEPFSFEGRGFSSRARITSTFKIDKTFNFQLQGFYRGPQRTRNQDREDMYALSFGASKTIWNGNGTISFNIQDIFNTRAMRFTTNGDSFTRESYMQWQPRQFALALTYRFKQGEKIDQPKKKKDINSNAAGDDQQGPM